jgi:hypothetical protein
MYPCVQVWLPNTQMPAMAGGMEAKDCIIGMTRLLCEHPIVQSDPDAWGAVLAGVMAVASPETDKRPEPADLDDDDIDVTLPDPAGGAVYSKLHYASSGE